MKIDDIDIQIVEILEQEGRTTNKEIARRLGLSEGTVRNRIRKLTESRYLKVKGLTNPALHPEKQVVFVLVKVPLHRGWNDTAKQISRLPEVKSVSLLAGRFDLLVEAFLSTHELVTFINERLAKIESIDATESLISVGHYEKWI